jgi:hypothetical protein
MRGNEMENITVSEIARDSRKALFSDTEFPFVKATLTLDDGSVMHVSQYPSEFPQWGVDNYFKGNGFPVWCHGHGARDSNVSAVNDDVESLLNAEVVRLLG